MLQETSMRGNNGRIIIIGLLILILLLVGVIGYFLVADMHISDLVGTLSKEQEQTIALDEFIVNLQSENTRSNYLKVKIVLMYTDSKKTEYMDASVNKIRDVILKELRKKTAKELYDVDNIPVFKAEIIEIVNMALKEDLVKDVYFTDLIIQ